MEKIKKELRESVVNSNMRDNMEIKKKAKMVEKPKNAAKFLQELIEIIKSNKKNIFWLQYQRNIIFQMFKEKEQFTKMITEFGASRSTISFKIAIDGLIKPVS